MITRRFLAASACSLACFLFSSGVSLAQSDFNVGRDVLTPLFQGLNQAAQNQQQNQQNSPRYYNNRPGNNSNRPNNFFGDNYYDDDYNYRPNYRRPTYTRDYERRGTSSSRSTVSSDSPKKNAAPTKWSKPKENKLELVARPITAGEIEAANALFDSRQRELVDVLERAMEDLFISPATIITELSKQDIPAETQTQIMQAVKAGKAEQAQILWASATKDIARAEEIYEQVELRGSLNEWQRKAAAGSLTALDLRDAETVLARAEVEAETLKEVNNALSRLDTLIKLRSAINSAAPGRANKASEVPSGVVAVIHNPRMPVGSVVTLGNGYCMCGTGGAGELEIHNEYVALGMGYPIADGECLEESDKDLVSNGTLLVNPEENDETIHYTVNDKSYKMAPGYSQTLGEDGGWKISFDRGGKWGRKSYKLSDATYHFVATDKGWDLVAKKFTAVIDNSENPNPFYYTINNKPYTVSANDRKTHASTYPMVVRFDRGNGDETKQACLEGGDYRVALNGEDNLWDLYPPQDEQNVGFTPAF